MFEPVPESVDEARRFVAATLASLDAPPQVIDKAAVAVSELADNAVRHAATNYAVTISAAESVRIAVEDFSPRPAEPRRGDERHGLTRLEEIGGRWGGYREGTGKQVWWEIDLRD